MKSLIAAVLLASALVVPAISFAQQANAPLSRAQVRADIVSAQKAGLLYQNDTEYPKAVPQGGAAVLASVQGSKDVGGVNAHSSESGAPASVQHGPLSIYRGH